MRRGNNRSTQSRNMVASFRIMTYHVRRVRWGHRVAGLAAWALASACASTAAPAGGPASSAEAEWRALASPRPTPQAGAARVSVSGVELLGQPAWTFAAPVAPSLALAELVNAGLLRRSDVRFVERRRFAAAVEAAQAGTPRPAGAPEPGVSEGAELVASVVWIPLPGGSAQLEVRLSEAARGAVVGSRRTTLPPTADPVATARLAVGAILATLADLGRRPAWADPVPNAAPPQFVASGIPATAVESFLVGLAAEESWRWDAARAAYQTATRSVGFVEAEAALARAARLRLGGTLGEN
jgi:hypothetical protein